MRSCPQAKEIIAKTLDLDAEVIDGGFAFVSKVADFLEEHATETELRQRANKAIADHADATTELATAKTRIAELENQLGQFATAKEEVAAAYKLGRGEALATDEVQLKIFSRARQTLASMGQPCPSIDEEVVRIAHKKTIAVLAGVGSNGSRFYDGNGREISREEAMRRPGVDSAAVSPIDAVAANIRKQLNIS